MASRRKGRILAFQALYSWDIRNSKTKYSPLPKDLLDFSWAQEKVLLDEELMAFARLLVSGTIENAAAVDSMITRHLQNWELWRLNRVDLAVLRMSVYTLMFQTDLPASIVIDEAIDISREFGTDDSYRFVNGVLDSVRKTLGSRLAPETESPGPAARK